MATPRTTLRGERISQEIKKYANEFLSDHSSRQSLITITRIDISTDNKQAYMRISVLPDSETPKAVSFIDRHLSEMQKFIRRKVSFNHLPFLNVSEDHGDQNRRRIDELIRDERNGSIENKA